MKCLESPAASRYAGVATTVALGAYLCLATRHLELPGLYYDETLQVGQAIGLLKGLHAPARWGLDIGSMTIPLMIGGYIGPLKSLALVPAFALGGYSVYSLRLTTILITLVGLVYTARAGRAIAGPIAAAIAVALAATDPSLILFTRADWGPVAIAFTLRIASLFYLWRWWTEKTRRDLIIGAALLGLGLYDKANFSWFIAAVGAAGAVGMFCDQDRPRPERRDVVLAVCAFVLASAPFWAFNLTHDWMTVRQLRSRTRPMNTSLVEAMPARAAALLLMLEGRSTAIWMFGEALPRRLGVSATPLAPLTIAATVILLWNARHSWRFLLFPMLMVVMLIAMFLMPRAIWVHHWIGVYPFPQLAIGAATMVVLDGAMKRRQWIGACLVCPLIASALAANLIVDASYRKLMVKTGGAAAWSDGIYQLHQLLETEYANRSIHVMGWGLSTQLQLLSGGQLQLRDSFWDALDRGQVTPKVVGLVRDRSNVFLAPLWPGRGRPAVSILEEAAESSGCAVESRRRYIKDRLGRNVHALIEFDASRCSPD